MKSNIKVVERKHLGRGGEEEEMEGWVLLKGSLVWLEHGEEKGGSKV